MAKPTIEQIEDELRQSQFQAWDVETFLAKRHQAKIDALTARRPTWGRRWQITKEVFWSVMGPGGVLLLHVIAGVWLIDGQFPLHSHTRAERACMAQPENPILPPLLRPTD